MLKKFVKSIVEISPSLAKFFWGLRDLSDSLKTPEGMRRGFELCGDSQIASGKFESIETELVRRLPTVVQNNHSLNACSLIFK